MLFEPAPYIIVGVILGGIFGGMWWALGGFFIGAALNGVVWGLNDYIQERKYKE